MENLTKVDSMSIPVIFIHKYHPDFKSLYFLSLALPGKRCTSRNITDRLKVDCGVGVTTDGYRLHLACLESDMLPDGEYLFQKVTKNEIYLAPIDINKFPNYSVLFVDRPQNGMRLSDSNFAVQMIEIYVNTGQVVNPDYLKPISEYLLLCNIKVEVHGRMIFVGDGNLGMAIMPLSVDDGSQV